MKKTIKPPIISVEFEDWIAEIFPPEILSESQVNALAMKFLAYGEGKFPPRELWPGLIAETTLDVLVSQ